MVNYCPDFGCTDRPNWNTFAVSQSAKSYYKSENTRQRAIRGEEEIVREGAEPGLMMHTFGQLLNVFDPTLDLHHREGRKFPYIVPLCGPSHVHHSNSNIFYRAFVVSTLLNSLKFYKAHIHPVYSVLFIYSKCIQVTLNGNDSLPCNIHIYIRI